MPRRFFIHIGMHKTGSSSIQESFFNSRERLLSRGINYLSLAANHSGSMYTLFSEHAHAYRPNLRRGADTPEKAAIRREAIRGDLIRELEGNKSAKFIVSGEDLSRLRLAEVTRLRDTLLPHASGFTIIIYVREPYSFLSSAVQQRVQRGFSFDQIWREPHLPNYRARIEPYIAAFGRENVDIRMFPPIDCGGDVVRDFVAAIGETDDSDPRRGERADQRLAQPRSDDDPRAGEPTPSDRPSRAIGQSRSRSHSQADRRIEICPSVRCRRPGSHEDRSGCGLAEPTPRQDRLRNCDGGRTTGSFRSGDASVAGGGPRWGGQAARKTRAGPIVAKQENKGWGKTEDQSAAPASSRRSACGMDWWEHDRAAQVLTPIRRVPANLVPFQQSLTACGVVHSQFRWFGVGRGRTFPVVERLIRRGMDREAGVRCRSSGTLWSRQAPR